MNDNKSRDIFYGVVAIATLIVAIVGATLAYFSISASSNEGAVNAKAAIVSIDYKDNQQVTAQATKLIPSSLQVMQYFYELNRASGSFSSSEGANENRCQDDYEKEICSVYRFGVSINSGTKNITAMLRSELNEFSYLSYAVRDNNCQSGVNADTTWSQFIANYNTIKECWITIETTTDGDQKSKGLDKCSNDEGEGEPNIPDCYTIDTNNANVKNYSTSNPLAMNSIFGYHEEVVDDQHIIRPNTREITAVEKTYDLVIFLLEQNENQNIDQGKEFKGTILVEVENQEGEITGKVNPNRQ